MILTALLLVIAQNPAQDPRYERLAPDTRARVVTYGRAGTAQFHRPAVSVRIGVKPQIDTTPFTRGSSAAV